MCDIDLLKYEKICKEKGYNLVCGVDEAGRGPLAGPVYAAAVILKENTPIKGINDSKKLSAKKREELFDIITNKSLCYSISFVLEDTIDEINILKATHLAMKQAVESLEINPDIVLIDGNSAPQLNMKTKTIVKGDSKSASIAAASILAKVARDRYMLKMAEVYPDYGFEKHKGYGTKLHVENILKHGPCPIHRKTFLKKILK